MKFKLTKLQKFLVCVFILLTIGATYKNYENKHVKSDIVYMDTLLENGTESEKLKYIFSEFSDDLVEGSNDAKITIIEYYSYKCKYCQMFNKSVLPQLRKNFIDNGIVKFVHRPVYDKQTIFLGGIISCLTSNDLKLNANDSFFSISKGDLEDIDNYSKNFIANHDVEDAEKLGECYNSDRVLNKIAYNQSKNVELLKLNRGVPVFIINGKVYRGYMSYDKLEIILNKLI